MDLGTRRKVVVSLLFGAIVLAGTCHTLGAHPLGGVLQKTVISNLTASMLVEYDTHIGPQVVLTLNPDKDLNGLLDDKEKTEFLDRVNHLLLENIDCWLGTKKLVLQEMSRSLSLEDPADYRNGLNIQFIWRVSLRQGGKPTEDGPFRIKDNNFKAGELNQLNYFVTVLGDTDSIGLADEGRELVWNISSKEGTFDPRGTSPPAPLSPGKSAVGARGNEDQTGSETGVLKSLLNESQTTAGLYILGLLTAFVLGAFHALSPGHGKSMVAAYLIDSRGRISEAIELGIVVTVTHVLSVIVLGLLALILSRYTLSGDVLPWLGVASGSLIFLTGYLLLAKMAIATDKHHHHHHSHSDLSHGSTEIQTEKARGHSVKEIISLGVAGGLVPCPSAIVILLFAISVDRIITGLLIVLSFSLGLAAVLILIGILTVTASKGLSKFGQNVAWIKRLPILSAGVIMILGIVIGINALIQAGVLTFHV